MHNGAPVAHPLVRVATGGAFQRPPRGANPLVGVIVSFYMMMRIPDAANMFYPEPFSDPLSVQAIWKIFLLGPIPGVALLLALGEMLGTMLWSNVLRIVLIGVVLIVDAINRLTSPWLSPSGTAIGILQTRTDRMQPCAPVYSHEWWSDAFCAQKALWGDYLLSPNGSRLHGPVTTEIAPELVIARVSLGLVAIVVVLGTAWWYHRQMRLPRTG